MFRHFTIQPSSGLVCSTQQQRVSATMAKSGDRPDQFAILSNFEVSETNEQHVTKRSCRCSLCARLYSGRKQVILERFSQRTRKKIQALHIIIILVVVKEGFLITISGQRIGYWTETGLVSVTGRLPSLLYYDRQNQTHCALAHICTLTTSTHHSPCSAPDSWLQPCTSTSLLLAFSLQKE